MRDLGVSEIGVFRRRPNAQYHSIGPSAAYGLSGGGLGGGGLRGGLGGGLGGGLRGGEGGGGGGDVVSYLVHWSRAAKPKLLQHRGCHNAAVMREFTATARRFTPSHRRSKTLAACGDAVAQHDSHVRLRVRSMLLLALA